MACSYELFLRNMWPPMPAGVNWPLTLPDPRIAVLESELTEQKTRIALLEEELAKLKDKHG